MIAAVLEKMKLSSDKSGARWKNGSHHSYELKSLKKDPVGQGYVLMKKKNWTKLD